MTLRVEIELLSSEGNSYEEIIEITGRSRVCAANWCTRFFKDRMEGLREKSRSGKPKVTTAQQEAQVIEKACSKTDGGYTRLSQRLIAKEVGISQTKVHKILKNADLKPHKTEYWCGTSPDPEFNAKMTEMIGLYMNQPENALVLCVNEKTQIQALDRTQT